MRKRGFILLILWLCLLIGLALGAQEAPGADASATDLSKHIQVVIVGIPDFSIESYNNKVLSKDIARRCIDLQNFFKRTFKNQVDFHVRCKKSTTTRESLRSLFQGELPSFAANNLTLVFIMTHGEIDDSRRNNFVSPDLTLVTSDSVHTDEKSWRLSTISVGADLMSWLEDVPEGSTILAFLDTCHGGAAVNLRTKIQGTLAQLFGLRMMVLASSVAQAKSHGASFTKALLEQWGSSKICLTDAHFADDIKDRVRGIVGDLSPLEGVPQMVVRFEGDLCIPLDRLQAGKTRLLLIYSGVSTLPTLFSVREVDSGLEVKSGRLADNPFQFLRLSPGQYKVSVNEEGASPISKVVDLTTDEPGMVFVRDLSHPKSVAAAYKAAADGAETIGLSPTEVAKLRKTAAAISVANGDKATATVIQTDLRKSGDEDARLEAVRGIAFRQMSDIQAYVREERTTKQAVGRHLILTGDFANAATLLEESLPLIPDIERRQVVARLTYFTYGAAGEVSDAQRIRQQNDLMLDKAYVVGNTILELERQANSSKEALDTFRSMATINMTIALKETEKLEGGTPSQIGSSEEWQQHILWSIRNADAGGSVDCPNAYIGVAPECLATGGRSCVMRKAIDAAERNKQAEAVRLSLITQCHNPQAADQIRSLGPQALTAYLTSTAAAFMGEGLWMGFGGVKVDYSAAKRYFLIAANHGNARAMANVGWIYENGFGVQKDYLQAKDWYEKADAHGDVIADWNLGRLYEFGWGVEKNLDVAKTWYQRGLDKGDSRAGKALNNLGKNDPFKM
jgi:hypothetical protein